jgi:hypothetical protein
LETQAQATMPLPKAALLVEDFLEEQQHLEVCLVEEQRRPLNQHQVACLGQHHLGQQPPLLGVYLEVEPGRRVPQHLLQQLVLSLVRRSQLLQQVEGDCLGSLQLGARLVACSELPLLLIALHPLPLPLQQAPRSVVSVPNLATQARPRLLADVSDILLYRTATLIGHV